MKRLLLGLVGCSLALGLVAAVCGCGTTTVSTTPASPASTSGGAAQPTTAPASVAHVGSTIAVSDGNGANARVALVKVVDPARGADEFTTPDSGKRFVGVVLRITNTGSATLQGDANNSTTITGSDEQTYNADFSSIKKYTNFSNGSFTIPPGQPSLGAVTFQLPKGVKVAQVQFDFNMGMGGGTAAQWTVH